MSRQGKTRSIHRSDLLLSVIGVLFMCALEARTLQTIASASPETGIACQVRQINDDASETSEFDFSGRVHQGQNYECGFVRGFTFQLRPAADGWEIVVRDARRDDNLARLTPSVNGKNPLLITGSDFRNEPDAGSNDLKNLSDERQFIFSPVPAWGNGSLRITNIDRRPEAPLGIADLSFDVSIHLDALQGVPVYAAGSGVTPPRVTYSPDPQYSKEARKAHLRGTVGLAVVVGPDGRPINIKVTQTLGKGLDEKAVEAVSNWKFKPGTKDGVPVPVRISIQCAFRYPGF